MSSAAHQAQRSAWPASLALALLAAGCGVASGVPLGEPLGEPLGQAPGAIMGGEVTASDKAVVGVMRYAGEIAEICTGSLISPNLVLTGRHCVARIENDVNGGVLCGTTTFTPPDGPGSFFVTTDTEISQDLGRYHTTREVLVPPTSNEVCGADLALLLLDAPIADGEARPLVPRVDEEIAAGEAYAAIGYGGTDDTGAGGGVRRRRDDLIVSCIGDACPSAFLAPTEWQGDEGICIGDSGGPALDAVGRVIGVTSRGGAACADPIYGSMRSWADWLKGEALRAAELAQAEPPPWSTGAPTEPVDPEPQENVLAATGGSCGVVPRRLAARSAAPPSIPWIIAALAFIARRRRRAR